MATLSRAMYLVKVYILRVSELYYIEKFYSLGISIIVISFLFIVNPVKIGWYYLWYKKPVVK